MWVTDFWAGPTGKSLSLYLANVDKKNQWKVYGHSICLKDGSHSQWMVGLEYVNSFLCVYFISSKCCFDVKESTNYQLFSITLEMPFLLGFGPFLSLLPLPFILPLFVSRRGVVAYSVKCHRFVSWIKTED